MNSSHSPGPMSAEMKERLLEASPAELRELAAAHPELSSTIDAIHAGQAAIAGFVERAVPFSAGERPAVTPAPTERSRGFRFLAPAGLLAAAVVALLLGRGLTAPGENEAPTTDGSATASAVAGADGSPGNPPSPRVVSTRDLDVETTSDFAVFPTDDPDIAVVWLLNGEDR